MRFIYLKGDRATIAARLATRTHEYMPASLLPSQFATLEEPADALAIDVSDDLEAKIDAIRTRLGLEPRDTR